MPTHGSSRFRTPYSHKDFRQKNPKTPSRLPSPASDRAAVVEAIEEKPTLLGTMQRKSHRAKMALVFSLIVHILFSAYIVNLIRQRYAPEPFEEMIAVDWVPPPPVKLKVRHREIPKEVPKVVPTTQKAASKLTTRVARRSSQDVSEVIVKGPEVVRESVEINRQAPMSQILPVVTTAAKFEAKVQTRDALAPPVATPTMIAAPGSGIVTHRVRAAGDGNAQGLSDADTFGMSLRGGSGAGSGLGDGFEDVGTTPPKIIQINEAADKDAKDLFGIGEYVTDTRGDDSQEVVYLLDVSSSMSGSKLRLAIAALKDALRMLYQGDSFNIVTFHTKVETYKSVMLPVDPENLNNAFRFLDRLKPRSGTNLSAGLERALALEASAIVLISDGDPSRGITDADEIRQMVRRHNGSRARIMTIALGHGHSDDGVRLLERLARENDGQLLLIDLR